MKNKKAQISLIVFLVLVLLVLIILPLSLGFSTYLLSKNVFVLLGTFLIVLGALGFTPLVPVPKDVPLILIIIGIVLLILPMAFRSFGGITLASVFL